MSMRPVSRRKSCRGCPTAKSAARSFRSMTSKGGEETSARPKKERIAKFLARAGVASRRAWEELIAAGRVRVNGAILTHPVTLVDANDAIAVDGAPLAAASQPPNWAFTQTPGTR